MNITKDITEGIRYAACSRNPYAYERGKSIPVKEIQFQDIVNGIKYAVCVRFMYAYEKIPYKILRDKVEIICSQMYDYAVSMYHRYSLYTYEVVKQEDEEEAEPIKPTPCGCAMFACWECGSYPICGEGDIPDEAYL